MNLESILAELDETPDPSRVNCGCGRAILALAVTNPELALGFHRETSKFRSDPTYRGPARLSSAFKKAGLDVSPTMIRNHNNGICETPVGQSCNCRRPRFEAILNHVIALHHGGDK